EQEHEPKCSHKNSQDRAHISNDILLQRPEVGRDFEHLQRFARTLRFRPLLPHASQILICQCDRYARLKPCDTGITVVFRAALGKTLRQEHVRGDVHESKVPRHYPDDSAWNEIDHERATKYIGIAAELSLPITITEDHGLRRTRRVV